MASPICPGWLLQQKTAFWSRFRPLICIMFCCIGTFFENITQNTTLYDHIFCCIHTFFENIMQNTALYDHIFYNVSTFFLKTQNLTKNYSIKYHIICIHRFCAEKCEWTNFFDNIMPRMALTAENSVLDTISAFDLHYVLLYRHIFRKHNAKHYLI